MSLLTSKENRRFISVLASDGSFREKVTETTPGAIKREYETSDGTKGEKWELVYAKLEGMITGLQFWDGDYGSSLQITVKNGEDEAILSLGVQTPFGEDMMKKLPNMDLTKPVSFEPYSFEDDNKKLRRGISIKQGGVKIENYYSAMEGKGKKQKRVSANGIPEPEGDVSGYKKDDWKLHFLKVRKFLVEQVEKLIATKFPHVAEAPVAYPTAEGEGIDSEKAGAGHF